METFRWRVSQRDGRLGELVDVVVRDEDGEMLRGMWESIDRTPPGERRSMLVRELRTHMDLFACFPGVAAEGPESASEPLPPPYLLHEPQEPELAESVAPTQPRDPVLF